MGFFSDLNEALRTVRQANNVHNKSIQVDDEVDIIGSDLNDAELLSLINNIKEKSYNRESRLKEYKYMAQDGIIGGALELIADESTLLDDITQLPFWVESDDKAFENYFNTWLKDTVKLQSKAWLYAYRIARDGDIVLRTYDSITDKNADDKRIKKLITIGDYFELVDDCSTVSELQLMDNTIGYQIVDKDSNFNDKILSNTDFIHVYRDTGERETIKVRYESEGEILERDFKIPYGTSFLESSRQAFMILDLLDTLVLSQRINKNQITRLVNVEVGNADTKKTRKMISEVKQAFKRSTLEKDKMYKEGNKGSTISNVYIPTRNGVGNVGMDEFGGNIDVRDLTDLEYYTNKLFASLRTPKEFLGFSEGGFFSEGSMTKKDIRFARMIRAIKSLLKDLVKEMVEFKKSKTKWNNKNITYHIDTVPVPSTEDSEVIDSLQASLVVADLLKTFLVENPHVREEDLTRYCLENILKLPKYDEFYDEEGEVDEDEQVGLDPLSQAQVDNMRATNDKNEE